LLLAVLLREGLYVVWLPQFEQDEEGRKRSDDPVSKSTVYEDQIDCLSVHVRRRANQ
jgi:hypothetical protein